MHIHELIERRRREADDFNATRHPTDLSSNKHAAETFEATEDAMVGVSIRTTEDALAAFDWIITNVDEGASDLGVYPPTAWLLQELRRFIARGAT